jgi:DNA (cytosine-5)-methyltransferase 1
MGWENAFWCENDPFCRRVLEYWFNKSKGYGDIRETDFTEWRGQIDVLTAGFPCQPFSTAGRRRGAGDDRYLWPEIIRVIREVRPAWFIGENVAGITSMVQPGREFEVESERTLFGAGYGKTVLQQRYILETVCGDIERAGYAVQPVIVPACAVGAPHRRDRIFIVSNANGNDVGGREYSEVGCSPEEGKGREKEREWIRKVAERIGKKGTASDANQLNGNLSGFCAGEVSQHEAPEIFKSGINAYAGSERQERRMCYGERYGIETLHLLECSEQTAFNATGRRRPQNNENEPSGQPEQNIPNWRNFPTQSPVCGRDDGLSAGMAGITFSRWRNESIKAFGNGIVPQVMFEFFRIIDSINNL